MIKKYSLWSALTLPYNEIGLDVKTWEPCDVHLGQVPRLQNDHGHPARCWLDKIYSIIRHLHLDQCGCLWKKVTWWHRETRSSPLPWLLSLSLLGVISLASERGQVSEEERSIPSNSTMTLEETVKKISPPTRPSPPPPRRPCCTGRRRERRSAGSGSVKRLQFQLVFGEHCESQILLKSIHFCHRQILCLFQKSLYMWVTYFRSLPSSKLKVFNKKIILPNSFRLFDQLLISSYLWGSISKLWDICSVRAWNLDEWQTNLSLHFM